MIEGLVAWVLKNYIGEYMELNTEQLSIALLRGQVDLQNVRIKPEALRKFDVPLRVKAGIIDKLTLQIPLTQIRSQPWLIRMTGFYLLLGPSTSSDGVAQVAHIEQYNEQKKAWVMDDLELHHKHQLLEKIGLTKDSELENRWWGASFATTISHNIQVVLNNLHVRYEDTNGDQNFAFGVSIRHLHIQTTNHLWKPEFVQPMDGKNVFKKFEVNGLMLYWNNLSDSCVRFFDPEALKDSMSECLNKENSYILKPFSMEARIEKNSSKHPLKSTPAIPRFTVDIRSKKIELELTSEQFVQISSLFNKWTLFDRSRLHRKWRPKFNIKQKPRDWWQFAIGRIIEDIKKHSFTSTNTAFMRCKHFNAYCRAYERRLKLFLEANRNASVAPAPAQNDPIREKRPLLHEDAALIKQIERDSDFNVNDLQMFRDIVFRKIMRELEAEVGAKTPPVSARTDSPFEITSDNESERYTFSSTNKRTDEIASNPSPPVPAVEQQAGWFGWISGWFAGGTLDSVLPEEPDINDALYLRMRPPKLPNHVLSPEFQKTEKRIEAEILQIFSETWDDSTILRRDLILAELMLKVDVVFARFTNRWPNVAEIRKQSDIDHLLTCDLRKMCCRSQISLKEHRTELSLSVDDMSIQHLQIFPDFNKMANSPSAAVSPHMANTPAHSPTTENDIELVDDESLFDAANGYDESLLYGFRNNEILNTQLLLTIGRANDELEIRDRTGRRYGSSSRVEIVQTDAASSPFLQLFYKRLAPKTEVLHELNVHLLPLSIICVDNAFQSILDLFKGDESEVIAKSEASVKRIAELTEIHSITIDQLFFNITIPQIIIELRNRKAAMKSLLFAEEQQVSKHSGSPYKGEKQEKGMHNMSSMESQIDSQAFARLYLDRVQLLMANEKSNQLCKINVAMHSFRLQDLFESDEIRSSECYLLRSGSNIRPNQKLAHNMTFSSSCPDLTAIGIDTDEQCCDMSSKKRPTYAQKMTFPKSLPLREQPFRLVPFDSATSCQLVHSSRNISLAQTSNKGTISIEVILIYPHHVDFLTLYGGKSCIVNGKFENDLDVVICRRTWAMLIEFFGLLGPLQENEAHEEKVEPCLLDVQFELPHAQILMRYSNTSDLGNIELSDIHVAFQIDLMNNTTPIEVQLYADELKLTDTTTSFFTENLYSDRFILRRCNSNAIEAVSRFQFPIVDDKPIQRKGRLLGLKLSKSRDETNQVSVDINIYPSDISYIHTQRFFSALLEYWCHFFDLQHQIQLQNTRMHKKSLHCLYSQDFNTNTYTFGNERAEKMRCQFVIHANSSERDGIRFILPLNSCSTEVAVFEGNELKLRTQWHQISEILEKLRKHSLISDGTNKEYDCLIEMYKLDFYKVTTRRAFYHRTGTHVYFVCLINTYCCYGHQHNPIAVINIRTWYSKIKRGLNEDITS